MNSLKTISKKMETVSKRLRDDIRIIDINPNPDMETRSKMINPLKEANQKMTDLAYRFLEDYPYNGNEAKKLFSIKTDILIKDIFSAVMAKTPQSSEPYNRTKLLTTISLGDLKDQSITASCN